ncbi:MAG: P-II family nitrogen regulator [Eubacterium sp.]|uniref:Nitrogen regulatory protein P-II family n=1 Tax=Eubacterium oxidoreducens TaxID=1732 RepID=A0A1G6BB12_EUBOX|nr:P-II family nitrogen regulator [Eubacterium oxidoreducens]MCR5666356.1 P-II family nitrogen regulator [Eubacterium sp.]SDB17852.1 nitrogen regulatory protein P-II family [Eubacterium oxidoreducens]
MKVAIEELSKVEIITKEAKVAELVKGFGKFGITGMTIYSAKGCGVQMGTREYEVEKNEEPLLLSKQVVMVVLPTAEVDSFLEYVEKELYTGHIGDGKIFVTPVTNAIRVRTGEEGMEALKEGALD